MSKDTRQKIMNTAKVLFNQKGFNVVSIGDISSELGISKGNLTYYFKKKEDIMEAILDDSAARMDPPTVPKTLAEMDDLFIHMQNVVQENAFYFWHHTQLSQLSNRIQKQQNAVYQRNIAIFKHAFTTMHSDGLIREEDVPYEYDSVIDSLLLTSIYWLQFCTLKQESSPQTSFHKQMWTVMLPLLTKKGKTALKSIIKFD